jgi:NAD(P)-dependent dehydrogenase (short-subunit alcohol dehydrogenase family)
MSRLNELSNLSGRTALITGASGRLGQIFSETLAELGCNLILVDLPGLDNKEEISDLKKMWGIEIEYISCNLEFQEQRLKLISKILDSGFALNVLVNNASLVGSSKLEGWSVKFENQSVETWQKAMEVNLTSVFELSQGLLPLLRKSQGANIVNISSIYGLYGPDWRLYENTNMANPAAYSVTKSGLIGLTRWLATTISPDVRVNAIAPGGIFRNQPDEFVKKYSSKTPLGRMATEDDFRGILQFLASDLSSYVTGQVISVDGGFGIW